MKEKKTPLFSPTQLATHMNERIGNTTINAAIASNHEILQCHFFEPLIESDEHLKLLDSIRSCTSDLALQGQLEKSWNNEINENDENDEEISTLFQHVRYACLYLELASVAEQNKARDRAWAFNNHASLMVGEIIERSALIQNRIEIETRSKQNSKNAKGRNKSILSVKEEVVRLLEEVKPEAGWPYKATAVATLERPLTDFIENNNILDIQPSNIEKWLTKWLREDDIVNRAWEKSKRAQGNNKV
jgi:hypothetical protein